MLITRIPRRAIMLAQVIKNSIIIILILLIVHFLIKNMLSTKRRSPIHQSTTVVKSTDLELVEKPFKASTEQLNDPTPLQVAPMSSISKEIEPKQPTVDELYEYIYEEKPPSELANQKPPSSEENPKDAKPSGSPALPPFHANEVIRQYDNEKTMNGGELFNGLNAYDHDFAPYERI
jgi:hypothetical protein